jgi:ubiquinone/menaquinone biosynthesis C-methylase UbiE
MLGAIEMQQTETELEQELARIREEYRRRDTSQALRRHYSLFNEAILLQFQSQERSLLALLKQHQLTNLTDKKILDVGCGSGIQLQRFITYGALPTNLSGIDLMANRIEQARRLNPAIDWQVGSAHQLPYPDASFDVVTIFLVLSSILSTTVRQRIADEAWRVRKPSGLILCYDFAYSNPRNPAVQGVSRRQIRQLFTRPEAKFAFRQVVLAPPISRLVAPHAYWLAHTLEQLKFLNTHVISIISKDPSQCAE